LGRGTKRNQSSRKAKYNGEELESVLNMSDGWSVRGSHLLCRERALFRPGFLEINFSKLETSLPVLAFNTAGPHVDGMPDGFQTLKQHNSTIYVDL
jgi:hypothetical protein